MAARVSRIDPAVERTTVDIDLLMARGDFDAVTAALDASGVVPSVTLGIDSFVTGPGAMTGRRSISSPPESS